MEESLIRISEINDFIFCPVSIYFHKLMADLDSIYYHTEKQIEGKKVHNAVDRQTYSTSKDVITSLDVFSSDYGLVGKIDIFNNKTGELIERKKHISKIYDGYVFQLYAQYYSMLEMGYDVKSLWIISYDDNKKYRIPLPYENEEYLLKFNKTIDEMRNFRIENFQQINSDKCKNCVYENICDRSLL